jgi:hypothetical protein
VRHVTTLRGQRHKNSNVEGSIVLFTPHSYQNLVTTYKLRDTRSRLFVAINDREGRLEQERVVSHR